VAVGIHKQQHDASWDGWPEAPQTRFVERAVGQFDGGCGHCNAGDGVVGIVGNDRVDIAAVECREQLAGDHGGG